MPTGAEAHQQGTDGHRLPEPTLEGALILLVFLLPGWSSQEDKRLSTTALALCNCFLLGGSWLLESPSGDLIGREPGLECGQTTFLLASGAFSLALRVHTQRREGAGGGPPEPRSPAGLGSLCSEGPLLLGLSVLRPSRAGSLHPRGPRCCGLKWYGCQRDLGVCMVGGTGGGLSGGVEDQRLQQHFI